MEHNEQSQFKKKIQDITVFNLTNEKKKNDDFFKVCYKIWSSSNCLKKIAAKINLAFIS